MQLSGRLEEKPKKRKGTAVPRTVFSAGATGETQSKEGLVRNAASPGPGVCGQGGAGDGRWSPISVQAVERSSLGSGVAAGGILRRKTQLSGPAGPECQLFDAGVVFRLSEDGSIG